MNISVFEQNRYLQQSRNCFGSSWNGLGVALGALGALLAALGALLGASWGDLGGSGLGTCSFLKVWVTQDGSDRGFRGGEQQPETNYW